MPVIKKGLLQTAMLAKNIVFDRHYKRKRLFKDFNVTCAITTMVIKLILYNNKHLINPRASNENLRM